MSGLMSHAGEGYEKLSKDVKFWRLSFKGGDDYKEGEDPRGRAILPKESHEDSTTYANRKALTPVYNLVAEFIGQRADGVFSEPITRPAVDGDKRDEVFADWVEDVDRGGHDLTEFMRRRLRDALIDRYVWIGIDTRPESDGLPTSLKEQLSDPAYRPYLVWASPLDVWDYEMQGDRVVRVVVHERWTEKASFTDEAVQHERWLEWTEKTLRIYTAHADDEGNTTLSHEEQPNAYGFVPWFRWEPLPGESYAERFAGLQRSILVTRSHMFAEQVGSTYTKWGITGVEDPAELAGQELGPGFGLALTGEQARFHRLSGDPQAMEQLRENFFADLVEAYRRSELSNRNARISGTSGNAQSGISKAYDHLELENLLKGLAGSAEGAELRIIEMFAAVAGLDAEPLMTSQYPKTFDLLSAESRLGQLWQVMDRAGLPIELRRETLKAIAMVLFPTETEGRREAMKAIEKMPANAAQQLLGSARPTQRAERTGAGGILAPTGTGP